MIGLYLMLKSCLLFEQSIGPSSSRGLVHGGTVKFAADDFVFHTDEVLTPAATHENHVVLLQIVAFSGHVGHHLATVAKAHLDALSVGAVRLLWLSDEGLQHNALKR